MMNERYQILTVKGFRLLTTTQQQIVEFEECPITIELRRIFMVKKGWRQFLPGDIILIKGKKALLPQRNRTFAIKIIHLIGNSILALKRPITINLLDVKFFCPAGQ